MTEQDLFGAIQQAMANRAGEPDPQDLACNALHSIAEAPPKSAVQMTEQDLFGGR